MEDQDLIALVTKATRVADKSFEHVGGSTRHWVRDCFFPALEDAGLKITPNTDFNLTPSVQVKQMLGR